MLQAYVQTTKRSVQRLKLKVLSRNLKQQLKSVTIVGYSFPFTLKPTVHMNKESEQKLSSSHEQVITKAEYGVDLYSD